MGVILQYTKVGIFNEGEVPGYLFLSFNDVPMAGKEEFNVEGGQTPDTLL
jgi:hypothetical protein